jgi:S1-C subfamily serine protease
LGIIVEEIPAVAAVFYKIPTGVVVVSIYENSSAYRQGLMPGDIIVAANGVKTDTSEALFAVINSLSVNDTITLEVFRVNQYYSVPVTLMDASSFN